MRMRFNSKMALFYEGGFTRTSEVLALLQKSKIELRLVEADALGLSVAALAGYVDVAMPTRPFEEAAPSKSCLVLSGLTEGLLNRVLDAINEAKLGIDYKAVVTAENRNWAFGALMQEIEAEQTEQTEKAKKRE